MVLSRQNPNRLKTPRGYESLAPGEVTEGFLSMSLHMLRAGPELMD